MKIIVLRNGVNNIPALENGISKAIQLLSGIGLSVDASYQDINRIFDSEPLHSDVVASGFGINAQEILDSANGTADIVCLISSYTKVRPFNFSVTNPINPCTYDLNKNMFNDTLAMEICEEWYNDLPDVLTQFFLHEMCHALYDKTGVLPDLTHYQYSNSNYSQKQPIDYYLYLLSGLVKSMQISAQPMQMYKYFQPKEIVGLKPELVQLLDQARGIANTPFTITSGLRTKLYNALIGGKANSAHLTGEAVDLACSDPLTRWLIVNALLKVGFNRLEVAKAHIHCDISKTLPQNIVDFSSDN